MDTLQAIISDIRVFLYSGIASLPLSLGGTMLLLGLFTANYAMLFFLVGFLVVVPFVNGVINLLANIAPDWLRTKTSDVCSVIIPFSSSFTSSSSSATPSYHIISQWMAMVTFFISYFIRNAISLMAREPEPTGAIEVTEAQVKELERKASYRKTQALVSLLSIMVVASVLYIHRIYTGCENWIGLIVGALLYGGAGYFWYEGLHAISQDRLADLFGIANRLLSPGAIANGPVVCLPVSDATPNP
jgi:hypothetical protein